ncbi:hypothetical protein ACRRTK_010224 [Alexandromys fortis]
MHAAAEGKEKTVQKEAEQTRTSEQQTWSFSQQVQFRVVRLVLYRGCNQLFIKTVGTLNGKGFQQFWRLKFQSAALGAGTSEKVLTEIIASRTPDELRAIKQVYEEEYGSSLKDDVVGDTSGYYQRMLVVLLQANRDPDTTINDTQVELDAQAGELKWETDEEKFITVFGTRSVSHLRRVFDKYMTISGFQIEETIYSRDFRELGAVAPGCG